MYTAKDAVTFADVEKTFNWHFNRLIDGIGQLVPSGMTRNEKTDKRIIGDMEHTYYIKLLDKGVEDIKASQKRLNDVVSAFQKTYHEIHFKLSESKDPFGDVCGFYLRVGATPPTDVPLAAKGMDYIIGEDIGEDHA